MENDELNDELFYKIFDMDKQKKIEEMFNKFEKRRRNIIKNCKKAYDEAMEEQNREIENCASTPAEKFLIMMEIHKRISNEMSEQENNLNEIKTPDVMFR